MPIKFNYNIDFFEMIWLMTSGIFILYWASQTLIEKGLTDRMYLVTIMGALLILTIVRKIIIITEPKKEKENA